MLQIKCKMITAKEANERTNKMINDCLANELSEIMYKISKEIQSGRYHLSDSGHLSQITKDKLIELGYKVENGSQYNESYYCIKWGDEDVSN